MSFNCTRNLYLFDISLEFLPRKEMRRLPLLFVRVHVLVAPSRSLRDIFRKIAALTGREFILIS